MILLGINGHKTECATTVCNFSECFLMLKGSYRKLTVNYNCLYLKNFTTSVCFSELSLMYSTLLIAYMNIFCFITPMIFTVQEGF